MEKVSSAASKSGLLQLRFNYAEDTVSFSTEDFSATAMRNSLIGIATTVPGLCRSGSVPVNLLLGGVVLRVSMATLLSLQIC